MTERGRARNPEPDRADYQRDLSVSYERLGGLLGALGEGEQARRYYHAEPRDPPAAGRRRARPRRLPLDPIVSLSVPLAEAPGSCACLLGAGVSVDAGVPTGWAIYRDGLQRFYRLEHETTDTPTDEQLDAWLEKTGRKDLGYSALLDLIAPDQAVRREVLRRISRMQPPAPRTRHWPT